MTPICNEILKGSLFVCRPIVAAGMSVSVVISFAACRKESLHKDDSKITQTLRNNPDFGNENPARIQSRKISGVNPDIKKNGALPETLVARLDQSYRDPEIRDSMKDFWAIKMNHNLTSGEIEHFSTSLNLIASAQHRTVGEVVTEMLLSFGNPAEKRELGWELRRAMEDRPIEYIEAVVKGTDGEARSSLINEFLDAAGKRLPLENLEYVYAKVPPGDDRNRVASHVVIVELVNGGLQSAIDTLQSLEMLDERKAALSSIIWKLNNNPEIRTNLEELQQIKTLASEYQLKFNLNESRGHKP